MALKAVLKSQEELDKLPEEVRQAYTEQDGEWALSVEGPTKREQELGAKVTEFRETNVGLMNDKVSLTGQLGEMTEKFKDVDPSIYQTLMSEKRQLETKNAKVVTNDALTEQIQKAVSAAVSPMQEQLNESKQRESEAQSKLDEATFRGLVQKTASEAGVRTAAIDDVLGRAVNMGFRLVDGEARIMNDGIVRFSTIKPDQPYGLLEWLLGLQRDGGSHLFKPSRSTGDQDSIGPGVRMEAGELKDPSLEQFSRNLENIAKGKVTVTRAANRS